MVTRSNAEVPMFFRTKSSGPAPISRSREPLGTMVAPWAGSISYATAAHRCPLGLGGSSVMIFSAHPGPPAHHSHIADRTRLIKCGPDNRTGLQQARSSDHVAQDRFEFHVEWAIFLTVLRVTYLLLDWGQGSS